MKIHAAFPTVFVIAVTVLACRDAARSPGGPSFSVTGDSGDGCQATHCSFQSRGTAADVGWFDPGTTVFSDTGGGGGTSVVFGSLSVSTNDSETFLFYSVSECGSTGCVQVLGGFGTIPGADFSAHGNGATLRTNTMDNPTFITFAGPAGLIEVEWRVNGFFASRFSGTSQSTQPGLRSHNTGQSESVSASAGGRIVDYAIAPENSGGISTNHNVRITISR